MNSLPTRRSVLAAACGTCAVALTGCAAYGSGAVAPVAAAPTAGPTPSIAAPSTGTGTPPADPTEAEAPTAAIPVADALAVASAIPVGGGMIFADLDLVVTQPSAGQFRAFSATCTHQGCAVTSVADGQIVCACHGSTFAVADGAVTAGPAGAPLPQRAVTVENGSIVLT